MSEKRRKLLICLHGSGDTGSGLRDWILSEDEDFENRMREHDIDVVFPSAEHIPYSMANGMRMNVWFDRKGLGATFPEDKKGVRRSVDRIASSYSKLNYTDVAVLGFSQGGCLSLHLGLGPSSLRYVSDIYKRVRSQHTHTHTNTHSNRIRSVVCMSSFLYDDSELFSYVSEHRSPPPLLMMHGNKDSMVPMSLGQGTFERFKKLSKKEWHIEWSEIPHLRHDMCCTELEYACKFMIKHLNA